jgi:hypothetical protein
VFFHGQRFFYFHIKRAGKELLSSCIVERLWRANHSLAEITGTLSPNTATNGNHLARYSMGTTPFPVNFSDCGSKVSNRTKQLRAFSKFCREGMVSRYCDNADRSTTPEKVLCALRLHECQQNCQQTALKKSAQVIAEFA